MIMNYGNNDQWLHIYFFFNIVIIIISIRFHAKYNN